MTIPSFVMMKTIWHPWFAWRPIRLAAGYVWFRWIERRLVLLDTSRWDYLAEWEYRSAS